MRSTNLSIRITFLQTQGKEFSRLLFFKEYQGNIVTRKDFLKNMPMSTIVLPQLQTIEAELASQVNQLEAQLSSVREQLTGIRAVMPMFAETANASASIAAEELTIESEPIVEDETISSDELEEDASVVAESDVSEAPKTTKRKETEAKRTASKKATSSKKASAQKTTAKKKDGRAASWQKYTRPGVKNESIPDAVRLILETQPENDFKIVDVMTALFTEDIPKSQYLKARNRISNVLSGGVRAGDWHKGERGSYRMTTA